MRKILFILLAISAGIIISSIYFATKIKQNIEDFIGAEIYHEKIKINKLYPYLHAYVYNTYLEGEEFCAYLPKTKIKINYLNNKRVKITSFSPSIEIKRLTFKEYKKIPVYFELIDANLVYSPTAYSKLYLNSAYILYSSNSLYINSKKNSVKFTNFPISVSAEEIKGKIKHSSKESKIYINGGKLKFNPLKKEIRFSSIVDLKEQFSIEELNIESFKLNNIKYYKTEDGLRLVSLGNPKGKELKINYKNREKIKITISKELSSSFIRFFLKDLSYILEAFDFDSISILFNPRSLNYSIEINKPYYSNKKFFNLELNFKKFCISGKLQEKNKRIEGEFYAQGDLFTIPEKINLSGDLKEDKLKLNFYIPSLYLGGYSKELRDISACLITQKNITHPIDLELTGKYKDGKVELKGEILKEGIKGRVDITSEKEGFYPTSVDFFASSEKVEILQLSSTINLEGISPLPFILSGSLTYNPLILEGDFFASPLCINESILKKEFLPLGKKLQVKGRVKADLLNNTYIVEGDFNSYEEDLRSLKGKFSYSYPNLELKEIEVEMARGAIHMLDYLPLCFKGKGILNLVEKKHTLELIAAEKNWTGLLKLDGETIKANLCYKDILKIQFIYSPKVIEGNIICDSLLIGDKDFSSKLNSKIIFYGEESGGGLINGKLVLSKLSINGLNLEEVECNLLYNKSNSELIIKSCKNEDIELYTKLYLTIPTKIEVFRIYSKKYGELELKGELWKDILNLSILAKLDIKGEEEDVRILSLPLIVQGRNTSLKVKQYSLTQVKKPGRIALVANLNLSYKQKLLNSEGEIKLTGENLISPYLQDIVKCINAEVKLKDNKIFFSYLNMELANGCNLILSSKEEFYPSDFSVVVRTEKRPLRVYIPNLFVGEAEGKIFFSYKKDKVVGEGEVKLKNGILEYPKESILKDTFLENVNWNISFIFGRGVKFSHQVGYAYLQGNSKLVMMGSNKEGIRLQGEILSKKGELRYGNRKFILTYGKATFLEEFTSCFLKLRAYSKVDETKLIILKISGYMGEKELKIDLSTTGWYPPPSEEEIKNFLGLGNKQTLDEEFFSLIFSPIKEEMYSNLAVDVNLSPPPFTQLFSKNTKDTKEQYSSLTGMSWEITKHMSDKIYLSYKGKLIPPSKEDKYPVLNSISFHFSPKEATEIVYSYDFSSRRLGRKPAHTISLTYSFSF